MTTEVYEISKALFQELWDGRTPLRLLGISLTNLSRDGEAQMSLFDEGDKEKARKIDKAVDAIRFVFDIIKNCERESRTEHERDHLQTERGLSDPEHRPAGADRPHAAGKFWQSMFTLENGGDF